MKQKVSSADLYDVYEYI